MIPDKVAGYKLYYSEQNFTLPISLTVPIVSTEIFGDTTATVSNLTDGLPYYFAVVSVDAEGAESDLSNTLSFPLPPEPPPLPDGSPTGPDTTKQINLIGMVPRLWLFPTNGLVMLAIQGAVGATFAIQSSTNPVIADSWITITNIKLSEVASTANPEPVTTLEKAFVPALQFFQDPNPPDGTFRSYRIYMPLGYAILANQVLAGHGFKTRLIVVRCPGLSGYIVCYVRDEAAYLDYNNTTYIVKLVESGPTIREIANKVAWTLQQNWTSASEFTVADDGTKFLFATVIRTDDPLTDPPLGVPRTSVDDILIDF